VLTGLTAMLTRDLPCLLGFDIRKLIDWKYDTTEMDTGRQPVIELARC